MDGTSSVDNATSAEDICKGEAPDTDLIFMPEGTGPQRDNAEGVSKGEVAVVAPEGAGPQLDNAEGVSEGEVADPIVAPEGAGPQLEGGDAPLKAGSISSPGGAAGLVSRTGSGPLPVPAEPSADGMSLSDRAIA